MNIVKPYARLCGTRIAEAPFTRADGVDLLRRIEYFGRISHRSEDKQTDDSYDRFIRANVLEHGDWSIVEHASVSIDMVVDRGITHEWVRHRLCAFTQESTRFVNYKKKMAPSFVYPFFTHELGEVNDSVESTKGQCAWEDLINHCEKTYKDLVEIGVAPQIARSVFPNALASRIATTTNLRNLRHVLIMRTTREAHPQMREVTIPLLAEVKEKIPILFEDIEPMAKQSESMKRGR